MALAGGWSHSSPWMLKPMPTLPDFAALFASFCDCFRECWVSYDSVIDRGARDPQRFGRVQVIHSFAKQAKNQARSNIETLGHEGKFAENRVDVEASEPERVGRVQPAPLTNA